jgi:membrane-bound metal-dependent hydrolase YbcI (DUF457 family)
MPDFKQHLAISGVATAATYFFMCNYYGRQLDFGEFLACEGVGLVAGAAPDALEPATDPNHRALGHSLALGTGLAKLAIAKCSKENGDWEEFLKIAAAVAIVAYIVHLIADGFTAKGLPLLGK